jgi:hypothetical protein
VRLTHLEGVITLLDDIQLMSARMATATGDAQWELHYHQYDRQLDVAITEALPVYTDLPLVWSPEFDHGLTVTADLNHLLNRDPPTCFSYSLNGFNGATYDVPGIFSA